MLTDFTGVDRVYITCGYTDLHRGVDGLAALVQQQFNLDPFTNTLFLFCGRRRDRIKTLYWEGNGFVLLYKRLESGSSSDPGKKAKPESLLYSSTAGSWRAYVLTSRRRIIQYADWKWFKKWHVILYFSVEICYNIYKNKMEKNQASTGNGHNFPRGMRGITGSEKEDF